MQRFLAISATALFLVVSGCKPDEPALEPPPAPQRRTATTSPATTGPAIISDEVMALVNGKPILMAPLYEVLVRGQGLEMAQQLVVNEIVSQEATRRGLDANDGDVQAEHKRLLADVFPSVSEFEQRERMLAQLLSERGWSRVRWELICRRNALLRKLAEPNAIVTEELIRAEYADQAGRKVEVRDIVVESLDAAEKVLKELRDKVPFEELAKKYSKHSSAASGGLLPPMTRAAPPGAPDPISAIRQVAFSLKEPGEVSEPVKEGYTFHLLQLVRYIEPDSAPFEAARGKIRAELQERLIRQWSQRVLMDLMNAAKVQFVDPTLREMNAKATVAQP
jgi:parvulin-like peptidyl-prolyl isomerase